jgi:putative sigma-54 modulation protein
MLTTFSTRGLELTDAIESYAARKIERFPRYFDRITQVEVVLERGKQEHRVEIITLVEHHEPFVASCSHEDLYAALDLAIDRTVRQLKDHKSRTRDHKHHIGGRPT